jgi:hypothetical protein
MLGRGQPINFVMDVSIAEYPLFVCQIQEGFQEGYSPYDK